MDRLNELLHELGISKVKLSKFLGVSRQMIYNYLELDDIIEIDMEQFGFEVDGIIDDEPLSDDKVNFWFLNNIRFIRASGYLPEFPFWRGN